MQSLEPPGSSASGTQKARFTAADLLPVGLGLLKRRWYLLLAGVVCSLAMARILPDKFSSYSYEARASLLHSNLPIPEDQKVFYQAPELKTVIALFTDRDTLKKLKDKEKLEVPLKLLENSLTAEVATGTKTIKVKMGWGNPDDAVRMLGETIDIVGQTLDEIRVEKLENHLAELEAEKTERAEFLNKARVALDEFHTRHRITDLETDLERYQLQIAEKQQMLEAAERNDADISVQQERLAQYMAEIKRREIEDAEADKQFEAAAETVSDNRRRQDRLRELIFEERRIQEVRAKIVAKKAEFQRLEALRKKGFASAQEVDGLKGEIAALEAQIQDSEKINAWEKELAEIDAVVVPKNAKKNVGSPIVQQTLFRELELTMSKLANDVRIRMIRDSMIRDTAEKQKLLSLRLQYDDLKRKLADAQEAERIAMERMQVLKSLTRIRKTELVTLSEPEIAPEGTKSNRKILMVAGLAGGFLPAFALVAGLEGLYWARRLKHRTVLLPLPVLGQYFPPREGEPAGRVPTQRSRLLAMKLRKLSPHYGTMIAFAGVDEHSRGLSALVSEIALSLSRRDERLLILDTRGIEGRSTFSRQPHVKKHREVPASGSGSGSGRNSGSGQGKNSKDLAVSSITDVTRLHLYPDEQDDRPGDQGESEEAGLSDFLGFLKLTIDEVKMPGPDYGIDVIAPGRVRLHAEALATHRMRDLIRELKTEYSMILALTDGLADSVALATMFEHLDGAIIVANQARPAPAAFANLAALMQDHATIWGQIVIETETQRP